PEPEAPAHQLDSSGSRNERARIVDLLGPIPIPLDDLIRLSGSPAALVHMTLLELEVAGRVARRDGGILALLCAFRFIPPRSTHPFTRPFMIVSPSSCGAR